MVWWMLGFVAWSIALFWTGYKRGSYVNTEVTAAFFRLEEKVKDYERKAENAVAEKRREMISEVGKAFNEIKGKFHL